MNLKELNSFKLSDAVTFHDTLNPKLWAGNKLRPEVKKQLEVIAQDFLEEMGINDLDVKDMTISGSNAAYSYTGHSDLDLHILVNMNDLPNSEIYKEFFNAKKSLYNDSHDITIHGVPVELYVENAAEPAVTLGEYSIMHDKWLRIPTKRRANFDQTATRLKFEKLLDIVERALQTEDLVKVQKVLKKIKQYRQAGLDKGGEFGPENLAFKALRSQGWITKLYALRDKLHSQALTIETMYQDPAKIIEDNLADEYASQFEEYQNTDEDYNPNDKPPGPEFPPTMPAGTVKVDVSDVYDWYKLGQHISNLNGLGKHDFGAGPPSTILAFGDEDTEHEYIKDLEKTGLTTTDIDPVDPNQPKGMKRQKVDPTYNVNEAFDQPYRLKWEHGDYGDVDAYAKLDDGNYLSIMFNKGYNQDKEEAWNVEFFRNNSQEVTGEGDAQRVFATVLSAIQKFIKKYKPNKVIFSASKEVEQGQNAQSRARLYDSLVQRYARAWGFRAFRADTGNKVIYELSRIQPVAEEVNTDFFNGPKNIDETIDAFGYKFTIHKTITKQTDFDNNGNKSYQDVPGITIKAYDPEQPKNTPIGYAKFVKETNQLGETWVASDETEVSEKYRSKGIATMMYTIVKSLGFDIRPSLFLSNYGERMWDKWGKDAKHLDSMAESSGYIPSEKQKNDPRFKTALTVDVKPDSIKKNAKAFSWLTNRAGVPPTAKPSGKI
jgi:hypothetical protein